MKVRTLNSDLISQIAAGEVVERPSHMTKELVENALDAKATKIEIHLQQGGRKVQITDNGEGIFKEDLAQCLLLHTTSKIQSIDDLWNLRSFGFRGEALSSISSVSQVYMISKQKESSQAFQVKSDFGKISEVEESSHHQGTTVIVEELFQNVPARLKFLKSDNTELFHIKNTLKAIALSHPEVEFKIKQNGELLFYWPKESDFSKRIETILETKKIYHNKLKTNSIETEVFVSAPNETQKTNRSMFFFAQKRWIQDRTLMSATLEAYRGLLMHSEYPTACVFVSLPDSDIDVNIHPTKSQVRFKNSSEAFRSVRGAVKGILEKTPWLDFVKPKTEVSNSLFSEAVKDQEQKTKEKSSKFENLSFSDESFHTTNYPQNYAHNIKEAVTSFSVQNSEKTQDHDINHKYRKTDFKKPSSNRSSLLESTLDRASVLENQKTQNFEKKWSNLQVLGQAQLTYIIAQNDHALVLIDQHAAHERVLYESLLENYKNKKLQIQNFLIPLTFQKDSALINAIESIEGKLKNLGLIVERTGLETLDVTAASCLLSEKAILTCLEEIGQEVLENEESFSVEKKIEHIVSTMACHSAVRAGKALSFDEMKSLLEKMDLYPFSCFCPHGRPVYREYSFSQLEKDFKRRV